MCGWELSLSLGSELAIIIYSWLAVTILLVTDATRTRLMSTRCLAKYDLISLRYHMRQNPLPTRRSV